MSIFHSTGFLFLSLFVSYPAKFMLCGSAGVHECLSNNWQNRVHIIWHLHIEDELRVLYNVDPEPQRQTRTKRQPNQIIKKLLSNTL